jgi:hypothetical protein
MNRRPPLSPLHRTSPASALFAALLLGSAMSVQAQTPQDITIN